MPYPLDGVDLPKWSGPAILLVDLDAFFASVEQLDHPDWRGKPVIVGGDPTRRGVVSTCSYEARKFGVRSAMPASQAARLCPDAIWTEGHYSRYKELSDKVMGILYDESPHLLQVSIDEAFLDVTPTRVNRDHPALVAKRIQERVDALGVTCSVGVGASKAVAKVASNMEKPHGVTVVAPELGAAFLAPLPVGEMSGVGAVAQSKLARFGIRTLGDLACADLGVLRDVFGKNAQLMADRARGVDAPVARDQAPEKSVSNEISVAESVTTREDVEGLIATTAHKVGRRLRRRGIEGNTLHLKVRYENLKIRTCQRTVAHLGTNESTWMPLLRDMLDELWEEGIALRLVGVGVSGLANVGELEVQDSLFDLGGLDDGDPRAAGESSGVAGASTAASANQEAMANLLRANDAIAKRFGEGAVRFGHEIRAYENTTGTKPKNPEDYKN